MVVRELFVAVSIATCILVLALAQAWPPAWWLFAFILPLICLGFYELFQRKHKALTLLLFILPGAPKPKSLPR